MAENFVKVKLGRPLPPDLEEISQGLIDTTANIVGEQIRKPQTK